MDRVGLDGQAHILNGNEFSKTLHHALGAQDWSGHERCSDSATLEFNAGVTAAGLRRRAFHAFSRTPHSPCCMYRLISISSTPSNMSQRGQMDESQSADST